MAAGPRRRDEPVKHLLAHLRPLELALEYRAGELERRADEDSETPGDTAHMEWLAEEFRELAAELHHW
jgi:hypothetical protein